MHTRTTFFHRSLSVLGAAFGAVAMTTALLTGYFSAPAATVVAGVIA